MAANRIAPDELQAAAHAVMQADPTAVQRLDDLCARFPDDARPAFLLGALLERLGRDEAAVVALDRALTLDQDLLQAVGAKAAVLMRTRQHDRALQLLDDALRRHPANAELWSNLGAVREAKEDWPGALSAYDRALACAVTPFAACLNRGYVLTRLGRLEEALQNNQALAALHPEIADTHFNVSEVSLALGRYEEALAACDRALAIDSRHVKARLDRAVALAALGRIDDAQQDLDQVEAIDPGALEQFNLGFSVGGNTVLRRHGGHALGFHFLFENMQRCDWTDREQMAGRIRALFELPPESARALRDPNLPFRTLGIDLAASERQALAVRIAKGIEFDCRGIRIDDAMRSERSGARLRIGYVSPDFRTHPTAFLTRRLYAGHDRSRFEVFGYALAPQDESAVAVDIRGGCDVFRDVTGQVAVDIARQVRRDGIDILVDLAGYTNLARGEVFALRPAPVQANWLAYAGTLGARYIDYAIVDDVVCPPGTDAFWTEQLVRMPHAYLIADGEPRIDDVPPDRGDAGLPAEGFVFCCFNNAWKIEPRIFSVWMEMLRDVPGSVLWLLAFREEVRTNLRREARSRGVDPDRLIFGAVLPNAKHLPRYRLADLFLDTHICNAHTTAIDALREGTPLLTVPGHSMQSRVAASLLHAMDADDLVCADFETYRARGVELATQPGAAAALRARLLRSRGTAPLFDGPRFIRNLESAYETMWRRSTDRSPPAAFEVQDAVPGRRPTPRWY